MILTQHAVLWSQIELSFSHDRGYYDNAFNLSLTSTNASDNIYFSTDYSKPSSSSNLYTGSLLVDSTTIIRALAINGTDTSEIITHSYIFLDSIIAKDYIESYIKDDPIYGPELKSSFEALPVLSFASDEIDSISQDLDEIEASSEMFWPNGEREGFMLHNGLQTWGGSATNPKKSYRMEFKSIYGSSKLDYDVFQGDSYHTPIGAVMPVKKFDKLLLRAGSQDGLNAEFGDESTAQFIRNRVIMDLMLSMGYPAAHGRFVHLFINGEYAGQYHLMERTDKSFFESYYGGNKEDYEVYKNGEIWDGPYMEPESLWDSLDARIDLSTNQEIAKTDSFLNLDQTAAYLLMMSYASGFDWSETSNCLGGTHISPGMGYRFIPYDMDFSLGNGGIWHPNFAGNVNFFSAPIINDGPVPNNLMGMQEFKIMLGDKMQCECVEEGVFQPDFIDSIYNLRSSEVETSLIAESARWGNTSFSYPFGHDAVSEWDVDDEWITEKQRVLIDYIPFRTDTLIGHFKANSIASDSLAVVFSNSGGHVSSGFQLTLSNPNSSGSIYYSLNGDDPRAIGGALSNSALLYTGPIVLPDGVLVVKARVKAGSGNQSSIDHWSNMCPKTFLVNQDFSNLVINEIHYNPNDSIIENGGMNDTIDGTSFEFVEILNRGTSILNLKGCKIEDGISLDIEENLFIPAGGFVVFAEDSIWFKNKYGFPPDGQYGGKLSNGGELLMLRDPLLNLIDSVSYNDENGWALTADHGSYSLGLMDSNLDNSVATSWKVQPPFYTPKSQNVFSDLGAHYFTGIVINEIHYHPPDTVDALNQVVDGDYYEFLEIKNTTGAAIDISGAVFTEGITYVFPASTILPSGSHLVLASSQAHFTDRYGFAAFGEYTGYLDNGGESIVLEDSAGDLLDLVSYSDASPWAIEADGAIDNNSLALINPTLDNDHHAVWRIQCASNQTPNVENDIGCYQCIDYTMLDHPEIDSNIYNSNSIETNGFVPASNNIKYEAQNFIILAQDFYTELGASFELIINPCID